MNLIYITIAVFALAAVLGLTILINWLSKKDVSKGVVYAHGLFAATGLVLLIVYAINNPENYPGLALILFVVAALGGFYLFFQDQMKQNRPASVGVVHAVLAVAAFVVLLFFAFS